MKWTGKGVLRVNGKDIHAGENIPEGMDPNQIKRLKKSGDIDGRLSNEAYDRAQAKVEDNKKKAESKTKKPEGAE